MKPVVNTAINDYVRPTVNTTLNEYVKPAVSSASHMVRDLQQTWDEDQKAEDRENKEAEERHDNKEGEVHKEEEGNEITEEKAKREDGEEDEEELSRVESLLSAMGSSVSTFGTAANFVGSVIQSGITKVQATNMDQVKTMANQVVETTKKATNTVVEQVHKREIVEKTLAAGHKTFDALEHAGKNALEFLLPDVDGHDQPVDPTSASTTTITTQQTENATQKQEPEDESEGEEDAAFDFNTYFDSVGGNTTLQGLAKSSEESTAMAQRKMRKIQVADRVSLDDMFNKIIELSEEEELSAEAVEISLGAEFEEVQTRSRNVTKEATEKLQNLVAQFKEGVEGGSVTEKAFQCADQVLVEGSKKIVELTVAGIEQILCASDLFTEQVKSQEPVNISETSLEENPNFPRIVFILKLVNSVHVEISQLSNAVIALLREVGTIAKTAGESDGVDKKVSANINTVYLETSSALSHIQDSKNLECLESLVIWQQHTCSMPYGGELPAIYLTGICFTE